MSVYDKIQGHGTTLQSSCKSSIVIAVADGEKAAASILATTPNDFASLTKALRRLGPTELDWWVQAMLGRRWWVRPRVSPISAAHRTPPRAALSLRRSEPETSWLHWTAGHDFPIGDGPDSNPTHIFA